MTNKLTPLTVMAFVLTIVTIGWVLHVGQMILLPLIIALLLCKLAQPLVDRLQRRGVPWFVTVAGLMLVFLLALWWVGGALYDNARAFLSDLQREEAVAAPAEPDSRQITWQSVCETIDSSLRQESGKLDLGKIGKAVKATVPALAGLFATSILTLIKVINELLLVFFFMMFIFAEQNASRCKILLAGAIADDAWRRSSRRSTATCTADLKRQDRDSLATAWVLLRRPCYSWERHTPPCSASWPSCSTTSHVRQHPGRDLPGRGRAGRTPAASRFAAALALYLAVNMVFGNVIEPASSASSLTCRRW